jgi:cytochrome c oxidase assembly protein subunit 15
MVLVMVVLGGLTRLTGSGLSMVEWQPLAVLPPLSEGAWQTMFAKYQASPQYHLVNSTMTLGGFKAIFWLEYVHRLWGRLIGLVFVVPFVVFLARRRIDRRDIPRLLVLFALGGLEGVLGWFMVKSGLAARPEVSHYRLAAHLMTATLIYGALLWSGLEFLRAGGDLAPLPSTRPLRRGLFALLGLVCLTIPAGALVAGLHAGLIYNDFPLMNGRWLPAEAFDLSPGWRNPLENVALVQFDHRLLAFVTWASAAGLWLWSRRLPLSPRARLAVGLVPAAATAQAGLGIATLLLVVPVTLAAAHQAGAFLLFSALLWALKTTSPSGA